MFVRKAATSGHRGHFLILRIPCLNGSDCVSVIYEQWILSNVNNGSQFKRKCVFVQHIAILPLSLVCTKGPPVRVNGAVKDMCCDKTRQRSVESAAEWWNREVRQRGGLEGIFLRNTFWRQKQKKTTFLCLRMNWKVATGKGRNANMHWTNEHILCSLYQQPHPAENPIRQLKNQKQRATSYTQSKQRKPQAFK